MRMSYLICVLLGLFLCSPTSGAFGEDTGQAAEKFETVVVTATRTEHLLANVPEETIVVSAAEIEKQNALNALEALRYVPGISVDVAHGSHGQDRYVINGVRSDYTLILIDGNRAKSRFLLSEIPASSIERIEIVKGANSLLYGSDAMSGVINVITKKASDKFTARLKGTYSTRKNLDGEDEKSNTQGATLGFKTGPLGHLLTYGREYDQPSAGSDLRFISDTFLGKWDLQAGENVELGLDFKFNQYEKKKGSARDMDVDSYVYALKMGWDIDEASSLQARVLFRDESDMYFSGKTVYETLQDEQEIIYTRQLGDRNLLTMGYQRTGEDLDVKDAAENWAKNQSSNNLFIQDEISLTDNFVLVPALRMDYHSEWKEEFNPKLSMLWKGPDSLRLRTSVGTAFKAPGLDDLYKQSFHRMPPHIMGGGFWILGNPDLTPEKSRSIRFSVEKHFGNVVFGRVALFRNDFEDMINMVFEPGKKKAGKSVYSYRNYEEALTQGVEAEVRYNITETLSASLGCSFLDTEDKKTGKDLDHMEKYRLLPMLRYDNHPLGLVAELRGDYRRYPARIIKKRRGKPYVYQDKDNFVVNASLSKTVTEYAKVWINADNLFDKKPESGYGSEGMKLTFGLEFLF